MSDYWFFLSYSRSDNSPYLKKFFADLAEAVRPRAVLPATLPYEEIGFVDWAGLEVGDPWREELVEGLQAARLIVALLSRAYLASDYCGKELEVFRRRVQAAIAQQPAGAKRPAVILPVLWDDPRRMPRLPDSVKELQYDHASLGEEYSRLGLRDLVQLNTHHDAYLTFVQAFAERIVEVAQATTLPRCDLPPLGEISSPFSAVSSADVASLQLGDGLPGTAQFIVVAGSRQEMQAIRQQCDAYGPTGGRDWRPFMPDFDRSVGSLLASTVAIDDLFPVELPVEPDLKDRLAEAEHTGTILLLVVDPWSTRIERYRAPLAEYDERRPINAQVVVPSNPTDVETVQVSDDLMGRLRATLSRTYVTDAASIREGVSTPEAFEREVIDAINAIRQRLTRYGEARRSVPQSGASRTLPPLSNTEAP